MLKPLNPFKPRSPRPLEDNECIFIALQLEKGEHRKLN
jgi:hypothetical protein